MSGLFFTELQSARELKQEPQHEESALPSIPPKIKLIPSKFQFNPGQPMALKKKAIVVKKATQKRKHVKLEKITEFVISHPTKLPSNVNDLTLIESQLVELLKDYTEFGEYENAAEIQRVLNSVKQKKNFVMKRDNEQPCEREELKKQELSFLVQEYMNQWEKTLTKFMEITQQQATKIAENHQEELNAFDTCIPQELTSEFRKHSAALLEKRIIEKRTAQIQDFDKAISIQKEADKLEKEESKIQMEKMKEHFMNKRSLLTNKHREQMSVFFEHAEKTREKIIFMRNQMIRGYLNRMKQIEYNINNICKENYIDRDQIPKTAITNERKAIVKKADKTPIPKCRPGTSFIRARSKLAPK